MTSWLEDVYRLLTAMISLAGVRLMGRGSWFFRSGAHQMDARTTAEWEVCRLMAGLAAAPLAAGVAGVAAYDVLWYIGLTARDAAIDSVDGALSLGTGVALVAIVMTILAVPIMAWLNNRGPLTLRVALGSGAALGAVPSLAITAIGLAIQDPLAEGVRPTWVLIPIFLGVTCGLGAAAMFWVVAVDGTRMHRGEPTFLSLSDS